MNTIPYDVQSCSLFFPGDINQLPVDEQKDKAFFSDLIVANLNKHNFEAALCAEFARLVYFKFEKSSKYLSELRSHINKAKANFNLLEYFSDENSTQAFIVENEDLVILAFRGTEPRIADIYTDIIALPTDWSDNTLNSKVHEGFKKALDSIWNEISSVLEPHLSSFPSKKLLITGHSLGAALAVLAAAKLEKYHQQLKLYTFGLPRIGNKAFTELFLNNINHDRYIDCSDFVSRIPPWFIHSGNFMYIDRNGNISPNPCFSTIFLDRLKAFFNYYRDYPISFFNKNVVKFRGLADHAPINYVSALTGLR